MNVLLDISEGQYRELTAKEMKEMNRLVSDSSKTI
jgi:hypothetical protein